MESLIYFPWGKEEGANFYGLFFWRGGINELTTSSIKV